VHARNQCLTPRNYDTGSNLADLGRTQCTTTSAPSVVDSEADSTYRWGGHAESLRRKRGDAAGVELGTSPVDRFRGERGNCPRSSLRRASSPCRGQAHRRLMAVGQDGGSVVLGGRESRPHGEGGQQVGSKDTGMPGGCRR
jgi:hypothetical protein